MASAADCALLALSPLILVWILLARVLSVIIPIIAPWAPYLIARPLYVAVPFAPYAFAAQGGFRGRMLRMGFEATYAMNGALGCCSGAGLRHVDVSGAWEIGLQRYGLGGDVRSWVVRRGGWEGRWAAWLDCTRHAASFSVGSPAAGSGWGVGGCSCHPLGPTVPGPRARCPDSSPSAVLLVGAFRVPLPVRGALRRRRGAPLPPRSALQCCAAS